MDRTGELHNLIDEIAESAFTEPALESLTKLNA
jgi:hypothetical protein